MALCQYCGKVEIAWHQVERKYVAFHAQRDAAGAVVKKDVRDGTRTVRRAVADLTKRHYPHEHWRPSDTRQASECALWTPQAASAMKKAGWRRAPAANAAPAEAVAEPMLATATPSEVEALATKLAEGTGADPALIAALMESIAKHRAAAQAIPTAAGIQTGTVGEAEESEPEAEPEPAAPPRLPEPEELMGADMLAAWARARKAIECDLVPTRVLLWGPPGTGKTEMPWRIAQERGWNHVYQLMTEETPGTELLGHLIVSGGNTVWCDGTLGRAIRASHEKPTVYVIDEVARASQDAMSACLLALTNPESLRLTLRSGEVIAPKVENWHVVATSNDDPSVLPGALADRLHINVRLLAPNPALVRSLTTVEARRLATAASREYSVRALLTYDRLRAGGMSMKEAAELVWEPEAAQSFADANRLEADGANQMPSYAGRAVRR